MSAMSSTVISTGPARGLVGGVTRHMQLLEEIARRISVDLEHFQIGRRQGEQGALAQLRRLWADYRNFARTLKSARASGSGVVAHINSSVRPVCVARDAGFVLIARALHVPAIFQVHGCLLNGPHDPKRLLRHAARWVIGRADRVVVLSKSQSIAIGGKAAMRAMPVNNAVFMTPLPERPALEGRPLRVLFLSRLVPEKGVDICLQAMQILRERGVSITLSMAGGGEMQDQLARNVEQMGLQSCVELLGPVPPESVHGLLEAHDLMWLPSTMPEGQPYSLLESLESGMPALVTRAGEVLGEMIDTAELYGGALIEVEATPESLAAHTQALADNPDEIRRLQRAARAAAEQEYSMEAVLPQWRLVWDMAQPPLKPSAA